MELKRLNDKQKNVCKILLCLNTIAVLGLATYYLVFYVIQSQPDNFFKSYVFLPLIIALLGTEVMEMSLLANNSSFKSNSSADKAMFMVGLILEGLAVIAIFGQIILHNLKG